ncbi:helix-turn-helix domain-containing protein [Actinosynnema sp. NPDC047251]|uniref:Transcriptional regulator, XRE family n=1 Tax=Saccharothrix espanaensis (strain ATCC 51144 / DSM 44229 / JCM 9112 / NBRC 15066 / NRRL 15764) TaxID=1179773 RepID=K0K3P7_SACES|nr:XRE family transcriptional regulator [Saccharothrix espanaensis]CCH31143.1 Transcriptional regulator, XRE family [Saccharothrix espanaensis DSM 44229]
MSTTAHDGAPEAFDALLKGYRVRAGLTQEDLAEGAGVSVRAISDMERGIARGPQRRTIAALAGPLRLSDDELAALHGIAKRGRARPAVTAVTALAPVAAGIPVRGPAGVLPPDVEDLAGRSPDLAALRAVAAEPADPRQRTGNVAVLSGPPGTGKTSVAVRAAHELAGYFPDGQFFLKLRGMSAEPGRPADVLHLVLRSLGVDAVQIPADPEQRAGLCRSLLRDRAVLIVLDDAADEAQVRPLLVGGPRCLTLVTSRHLLVGLEGVRRFPLGALDLDAGLALLTTIIGPARVARERPVAAELVELCGRLPLALRVAGNRLASRPVWSIGRLVDQLRDRDRRLSALTAGDLDVRSVFTLSYQQLSPDAARAFRRLSLVPGADFSAGTARVLTDVPDEDDAADCLEELTDASLLQLSPAEGRYQFHDLLRVFAAERLDRDETPEDIGRARDRHTRWLVATATAAARYFQPSGDVDSPPAATPWFADHLGAGRWLDAEAENWPAALRGTAARGDHRAVLGLSEAMHWYSEFGGTASLWHEVFGLGVQAAVALGSKRDEAVQRNYQSWVLAVLLGRSADAVRMTGLARDAAVEAGDLREQAWARTYQANSELREGRHAVAVPLLDEAVGLFDRAGYRLGSFVARSIRAGCLHVDGRFHEAADEFAACLDYFAPAPDAPDNPVDDNNYAYLLLRSAGNLAALSSLDAAFRQSEEALRLFRVHGALMGQARALRLGGTFLRGQGDLPGARAHLADALVLFERTGQHTAHADALRELASLTDESGTHSA